MKSNAKKFGEYLRKLRKDRHLTLRDVEELTAISNSYLSQVESGKRGIPHLQKLLALAEVYKVELNEILEEAGLVTGPSTSLKDRIDRAIEFIRRDPDFEYGHKLSEDDMSFDAKRFIIEVYEKSTGKKVLKEE
ncbi:helix-turn-helix domain-containing protein [Candidatus Pacearchaeota archaeon]|nr:helix-turn-helix domain-containing protein [Candidatus Pacearchaeota archaeon]